MVHYLSDMLPTSLQHLHLDEMAPYPYCYELPMHYVQLLHFLSDSSFVALQTFVFSARQIERQLEECGEEYPSIPDELDRLAEAKSMDIWAWSPDNQSNFCLEKRSRDSTQPHKLSGPPSGPFIYG
jgi:hypothetical protein